MIADRRPQTGPAAVTLSDLMQLPKEQLQAMANDPKQSIAPPYMTLAALSAVNKMQMGAMKPQQQGTIKDQVLAQSQPPIAAGIGGLPAPMQPAQATQPRPPVQAGIAPAAPPQTFADGGKVQYSDELDPYGVPLSDRLKKLFKVRQRGESENPNTTAEMLNQWFWQQGGENATKPTTSSGRSTGVGGPTAEEMAAWAEQQKKALPGEKIPGATPGIGGGSVSASSRSKGIGGTGGRNPFIEYGKDNVALKPAGAFDVEKAPDDQYLNAALEKYSKPDEARMRELRNAEANAGLAAFGAGMVAPGRRGFGAAYAPAVKESIDAIESKADKRRAYEDAREKTALDLGLRKGTREYDEWKRQYDAKQKERELDYAEQNRRQTRGDTQIDKQNEFGLKQRQLDIAEEGNRLQAAIRADANKDRYLGVMQQWIANARKEANDRAIDVHGKPDPYTGMIRPDAARLIEVAATRFYKEMGGPQMDAMFRQTMERYSGIKGLPTTGAAAPTVGNRGPLLGK